MEKYIALLRGINVGGNNKISMTELKTMFEKIGFSDVSSYINSGNIIFSSVDDNEEEMIRKCRSEIANQFKLDISVTVISAKDLAEALENAPVWWDQDNQSKHNAIFVIPPAGAEAIIEQAGAAKPEYEKIGVYGQVIFWSAPIATFSKTRWSKVVSSDAYGNITIRNANTAKKLLQLSK